MLHFFYVYHNDTKETFSRTLKLLNDNNQSQKFWDQSPFPQISMLWGDLAAFGWTVLVIQVACTLDTTLSWEEEALEYPKRTNFGVYLFSPAKKIIFC